MRIIPGRSLLLALGAPLLLSLVAIAEPATVVPMLIADGVILLLAAVDLLFIRKAGVEVIREVPETLSLARPVTVTLEVKNRLRRKLKLQINEALFAHAEAEGLPVTLDIGPGVVRRAAYRLRAMERGTQVLGEHYVRYSSSAGFWTRQVKIPAETKIRVFPDVQAVRHYEMLARQDRDHRTSRLVRMRGGDTEFERLRDYLPDDEFRRIDWRSTARRRKLTVREFQLEKNQNIVFLVDCGRMMTATWDDLTALDYALNAVLMLSHVAIRRGDQVGLIAFDEKVTRLIKPQAGISASNRIIQGTFDLFPKMVESDYEGAFRALKMHVKKRTLVVFISHVIDELTSRRIQVLTRDLLSQHLPLCALLKDREVEASAYELGSNEEAGCVQGATA